MDYLDLTLPTAADNLALDEALLLEAEAGRGNEILRLWEWPLPAVILGSGTRLAEDVNETACRQDAVPILRRSSGGGTVLLARGCLVYSLVLLYESAAELGQILSSYGYILGRLAEALKPVAPEVAWAGTSDLALGDRKFSGSAQQRKRLALLHHGTLLYDFPLSHMPRYLNLPHRQPQYREHRSHLDFVTNLPTTIVELKERLRTAWNADRETTTWPFELTAALSAGKYTTSEWTERR